jgi:hypothetical protein
MRTDAPVIAALMAVGGARTLGLLEVFRPTAMDGHP